VSTGGVKSSTVRTDDATQTSNRKRGEEAKVHQKEGNDQGRLAKHILIYSKERNLEDRKPSKPLGADKTARGGTDHFREKNPGRQRKGKSSPCRPIYI